MAEEFLFLHFGAFVFEEKHIQCEDIIEDVSSQQEKEKTGAKTEGVVEIMSEYGFLFEFRNPVLKSRKPFFINLKFSLNFVKFIENVFHPLPIIRSLQ